MFSSEKFSASKECCDVHIGKNYFIGDLSSYKIHVEFDKFFVIEWLYIMEGADYLVVSVFLLTEDK